MAVALTIFFSLAAARGSFGSTFSCAWLSLTIALVGVSTSAAWVWSTPGQNLAPRLVSVAIPIALPVVAALSLRVDGVDEFGRIEIHWAWESPVEDRSIRFVVETDEGTGEMIARRVESTPSEDAERARKAKEREARADSYFAGQESYSDAVELAAGPSDWSQFRGPYRDGSASIGERSLNWQDRPPRTVWTQPIGKGWSSFSVAGRFAVTHEQRVGKECVVCYDWRTGKQCWSTPHEGRIDEYWTGEGPRATPAIANGRVYAFGSRGVLVCLDGRDGRLIWQRNVLDEQGSPQLLFGMCGSPLVVDGLVIVSPGGTGCATVAYAAETGEQRWSAGDAAGSYSSPQLAKVAERSVVLCFHGDGLFAHDLANGDVLWTVPWVSNPPEKNNVCQPIVLGHEADRSAFRVILSSGYGVGSALMEVTPTGEGHAVATRWRSSVLQSKFSSCVTRDGYVYGLDNGILTCVRAIDGKRMWKGGRYGFGQLVLIDDMLLVSAERGELVLVAPLPNQHVERGRFRVLKGTCWSHPTPIGRYLLVRNNSDAALVEL